MAEPAQQRAVGAQAVQLGVQRDQAAGGMVEQAVCAVAGGAGEGQVDLHGGSDTVDSAKGVLAGRYRMPNGKIQPVRPAIAGCFQRISPRKSPAGSRRRGLV